MCGHEDFPCCGCDEDFAVVLYAGRTPVDIDEDDLFDEEEDCV